MRIRFQNMLYYFTLPGTILHEIAHALIVWLIPNMRVTDIDLTSHVEYEGYNLTATRTFLVAYAPLFFNTLISVLSVYIVAQINSFQSVKYFILTIFLIYLSLITAFTSLPSVEDAVAPLKLLRSQFLTRRMPYIIIIGPIFIILSIPGLIISYMSKKSIYIQFILCCIYALLVFLIGFEVITEEHITILYNTIIN